MAATPHAAAKTALAKPNPPMEVAAFVPGEGASVGGSEIADGEGETGALAAREDDGDGDGAAAVGVGASATVGDILGGDGGGQGEITMAGNRQGWLEEGWFYTEICVLGG
ncbi:hypothetical protein MLD38_032385 [Melastoma candidum]|uniref:Uncharacterized protein n=1 Tax=Melastoma candidum TaxID=119954 RepID=A0ACB9M7Q4_9MYRT|nr:hypothetical protein MLD38_032385 [Melastoma candidum]